MALEPRKFTTPWQEARARAGLTQLEVAAAAQIDDSVLSRIERGIRRPTTEQRRRLAEALALEGEAAA